MREADPLKFFIIVCRLPPLRLCSCTTQRAFNHAMCHGSREGSPAVAPPQHSPQRSPPPGAPDAGSSTRPHLQPPLAPPLPVQQPGTPPAPWAAGSKEPPGAPQRHGPLPPPPEMPPEVREVLHPSAAVVLERAQQLLRNAAGEGKPQHS